MRLKMFIASMVILILFSVPALAGEFANQKIIESTNNIRVSHGLREYKVGPVISRVAQNYSEKLAEYQKLIHNSSLGRLVPNWSVLGENIGYGSGWRDIQIQFLDSRGHRVNILSTEYRRIGVGSTRDRYGTLWVVVVFKKPLE